MGKKKNKKKKNKKSSTSIQPAVKQHETTAAAEKDEAIATKEPETQDIQTAAITEESQPAEKQEEEIKPPVEDQQEEIEDEEEQEFEEEDDEEYEVFESWGAQEHSKVPFKPIVVTALVLFLSGVGAITYIFYSDPAAVWDRAEVVDTDEEAQEPEIKTATALPSSTKKTEIVEKAVATSSVAISQEAEAEVQTVTDGVTAETVEGEEETEAVDPSQEPTQEIAQVEQPAVEQPEPELPTPAAEPAVVEEVPASAEYAQLLEDAKKTRGLKKKIGAFRTAIEANPSGYEALAELAILLMDRRPSREEAFDMATRSAEINDDNGAAWLAIGYIHQLNGKAAEAREAYKKCAESTGPKSYVRDCRRM